MDMITQSELGDRVAAVVHRVEAGESLLVTVAGRVVVRLFPGSSQMRV